MKKINLLAIFIALLVTSHSFSQLSNQEYVKAGWMTGRMYGGNRSGNGPNWLIMTYGRGYDFVKDADGAHNLVGGWHDCGDHVKFGQTQFYAGYMLLLGYSAFPAGYDDFYSADYSGYESSGNFSFEGGAGTPNGIPDILDEVKYATDYYIKCIPNGSTFYSQVGNGDYDHRNWVTSVTMASYSNNEGGEADGSRVIKKNPNDASMVSFAGATLALMSRMYRHFDDAYADECLQYAEYAYEYASAHKTNSGGGTITGSFYGADNKWEDNYVCLLAELYWATGDEAYKTEALSYSADITVHGWVLDYENSDDLAAYALAKLGDSHGESVLNTICTNYKSAANGDDVMEVGSDWGRLRYTASATFVLALQHAYNNDGTIHSALQGSIDYILGANSANQSFVVGFGSNSPQRPHHRNVYMNDNQNYNIPTKNQQQGYLVGGTFDPYSFPDNIDDFQTSEGGIDYNAGLVGALGYINSILSPVDQSKFGFQDCNSPDLGDNKSLCGVGTITLDSQLPTTNRTFSWDKDGTSLSENGPSLSISTGGTYTVTADSSGCVTSDIIAISDEIPDINLGEDQVINGTITLNTQVSGDVLTYSWTKNGSTLPDDTQSISVSESGTYGVTVSGIGCTSKSDEIILSAPPALVQTTSAISIDGTKDAVYTNGTALESFLAGTPTATSLSGEWSGMWDNSNVYIFISVTDDALYNDSGETWYEDDGIEVFIDGDNSKSTAYDNNDFQWGFVWGGSLYAGSNNSANSTTGIVYEIVQTANGYNLEISIPWSTIGVTPVVGNFIGFDLGINDDDDGDARENKIAWYMTSDDGWQNPSILGELELVETTEVLSNQTISLSAGWNLISFNVLPADNSIASVFASADVSIIKNSDGFWMPTQAEQFNSL
ncbi:MAG: glycoside hydrolase family 9 protein, partial [Bacteroidales bacterium]|nr:glycoside hydrolase family 9 protein [Bacteroidales bacterium]